MKDDIDAYAGRYGILADKVWREEYLRSPMVTRCAPSSVGLPLAAKGIDGSQRLEARAAQDW